MENQDHQTPQDRAYQVIEEWQEKLHGDDADTRARAELRRCRSLDEVFLTRTYYQLEHAIKRSGLSIRSDWLACVAGLLPYLKNPHKESFARRAATSKEGASNPRLSDLRFRRLLKRETRSDLFLPLIRVLQLVKGEANVRTLADDLYWWEISPKARQRWAREYYSQLLSADNATAS